MYHRSIVQHYDYLHIIFSFLRGIIMNSWWAHHCHVPHHHRSLMAYNIARDLLLHVDKSIRYYHHSCSVTACLVRHMITSELSRFMRRFAALNWVVRTLSSLSPWYSSTPFRPSLSSMRCPLCSEFLFLNAKKLSNVLSSLHWTNQHLLLPTWNLSVQMTPSESLFFFVPSAYTQSKCSCIRFRVWCGCVARRCGFVT